MPDLSTELEPARLTVRAPEPISTTDSGIDRLARGVFRYLRVLGASPGVADDLTQEAFVVAWRKGKQGLEPKALGAYLRETARLLWLQEHRRDRRRQAALAAAADRAWDRHCSSDGGDRLAEALSGCVHALGERARRALLLAYSDGRGRDAIAAELGMRPNGVKTLLQRVRKTLADCVARRLTR